MSIPPRHVWVGIIIIRCHSIRIATNMEPLTYRDRLHRFINSREKALKIHATRLRNNMSALARTWDNTKWAKFIVTFEREIVTLLPSEESRFHKQRTAILQLIEEAKLLVAFSQYS